MAYVRALLNQEMIQVDCMGSFSGGSWPIRTFYFEVDEDLSRRTMIAEIMDHCGNDTTQNDCGYVSLVWRELMFKKCSLDGKIEYEHFISVPDYNPDNDKMRLLCTLEAIKNQKQAEYNKRPLIKYTEIKVDVFRAQPNGGMQTGTISSGVRVTHTPTGVTHECSANRSQHDNKSDALLALLTELLSKGWRE